jgi:RNA polymerase-binding transcription factor DksA
VAVTADDEDATPVVRRRSLSPGPSTVEEAIFDLEMLDADFLLYEDVATGDHAVVHHRPDARIGLVRYGPHAGHAHDQLPADVVVEPGPPTLTPADAVERLRAGGEPFVAVVDATTGRAVVAYRRWDGRLGVVTPADEPISPAEPRAARRRLRRELDRLEGVRSTIWAEGIDAMTEAEDIAELSAVDQHPADLGTETFERERDLSLLQEVDAEIDAVRRALARIPLGTYGTCEACGEPIPDERLRAVPATRLCLDDQLRAEADSGLHDGRP